MFLHLYKSLVRPHLEYASPVWSPYLKKYKKAIENVQKRATRMIPTLRNLNYTERLRNLGLPSLEYRRERADMIQVFKMTNKIDQPSIPIITLSENNRTRGNEHK